MTNTTWTWMMYFATHTQDDIASARAHSLALVRRGIEQGGQNDSVRVLIQDATPTECVRSIVGATSVVVANLGQVDSGDPVTLLDFIRWAVTTAPAQHYALVIWSHGSGRRYPGPAQSTARYRCCYHGPADGGTLLCLLQCAH